MIAAAFYSSTSFDFAIGLGAPLLVVTAVILFVSVMFFRRYTKDKSDARLRAFAANQGLILYCGDQLTHCDIVTRTAATTFHTRTLLGSGEAKGRYGVFEEMVSKGTPASKKPRSPKTWHVLTLPVSRSGAWIVALRPVSQKVSLVDLLGPGYAKPGNELQSCPSVELPDAGLSGDVFVPFASVRANTQCLAALAKIVPADVTLLLSDHELVLEFSARPFTPNTLSQMTQVAHEILKALSSI